MDQGKGAVKRRIYATDLDNTLIYSHKFIAQHQIPLAEVSCVEQYNGKDINYVHNEVVKGLRRFKASDCLFMPVTTRRTEQYLRINLGFTPEYAIVSNGGVILRNNQPLAEWTATVNNAIDRDAMYEIADICRHTFLSITHDVTICDSCFIFFKLENPDEFASFIPTLQQLFPTWTFVNYSQKCYAFPKICSKGGALKWLAEYLNCRIAIATGDSTLDTSMLDTACLAVVPSHSSLCSSRYTYVDGGMLSPLNTMKILFSNKEEK